MRHGTLSFLPSLSVCRACARRTGCLMAAAFGLTVMATPVAVALHAASVEPSVAGLRLAFATAFDDASDPQATPRWAGNLPRTVQTSTVVPVYCSSKCLTEPTMVAQR